MYSFNSFYTKIFRLLSTKTSTKYFIALLICFFFVRGIVPCFVKLSKMFFNLYARMWLIFGFLTVWFRIFLIIFFIWNILYVLLIHLFFKKFLHRFQKRFCRVVFCYFFYIYIFLYSLGVKMDNEYFICFWLLNCSLNIFPKIGFRQNELSHFFRILYLLTKETKIKTNLKVKLD